MKGYDTAGRIISGLVIVSLISFSAVVVWAGAKDKKKAGRQPSEVRTTATDNKEPEPVQAKEGVVNINTATEEELCLLPGIGPKKAAAIVDARSRKSFDSPKQLLRVKGIGRKSLKRLLPYVTVSGPTTLRTKVNSH